MHKKMRRKLGIWSHLLKKSAKKKQTERIFDFVFFVINLASALNFTENNTPPSILFTLFKLYKWYQITQSVSIDTMLFTMQIYI